MTKVVAVDTIRSFIQSYHEEEVLTFGVSLLGQLRCHLQRDVWDLHQVSSLRFLAR